MTTVQSTASTLLPVAKLIAFVTLLGVSILFARFSILWDQRTNKPQEAQVAELQWRSMALEMALRLTSDSLNQAHSEARNRAHNDAIERAARLCDERIGPENPISAAVRNLRVRPNRKQIATPDYPLLTDVIARPE